MKAILAPILTLTVAAMAPAGETANPGPCKQCDPPTGRAALMLGKKAPGPQSTFVVTGMTGAGCSGKLGAALAKVDGVTVDSVCPKSGHAIVELDSARVQSMDVVTAITATGFKVTGELARFRIPAMNHETGAGAVEKALGRVDGVARIETTVTPSQGTATVVFDPAKTDKARLETAINASGFKVAKGA